MLLEPIPHLFLMVDTHIVTDDVNNGNGGGRLPIDPVEKANKFLLPLAVEVQTDDFAGSGIEGRKEVQCPISFVLMLDQVRLVSRLCGLGGGDPGSLGCRDVFSSTERTYYPRSGSMPKRPVRKSSMA